MSLENRKNKNPLRSGVITRERLGKSEESKPFSFAADRSATTNSSVISTPSSPRSIGRRRTPASISVSKKLRIIICLAIFMSFAAILASIVSLVPKNMDDIASILTNSMSVMGTIGGHGDSCSDYEGVLRISQGNIEDSAATLFFFSVLNQILYAEKHKLIPWIHLDSVSHKVYDPYVHGGRRNNNDDNSNSTTTSFSMPHGVKVSWTGFTDPVSQENVMYPGPPVATNKRSSSPRLQRTVTVYGNGVWDSYFEPASPLFAPTPIDENRICSELPLITMGAPQNKKKQQAVIAALNLNAPWALRAWRYTGLPPSLQQREYNEWFSPMRLKGSTLVGKYVKFRPYLHALAEKANPTSISSIPNSCLAVHIQHTGKVDPRRKIPIETFLPYVQAYVDEMTSAASATKKTHNNNNQSSFSVYLATDSRPVLEDIQKSWPPQILSKMKWQANAILSQDGTTSVSSKSVNASSPLSNERQQKPRHHLTNTQVLVDILAMAKCQFLLHGLSAVSEAVHYLNFKQLSSSSQSSVNLEIPYHPPVDDFRGGVRSWLHRKV